MTMTAEPEVVETTDETHDGAPPAGTGGSQPGDDGSAVEEVVEETAEAADGSRTEEPESEKVGKGASPDAERIREMEAEVADARLLAADIRAIAAQNPHVARAFGLPVPEGAAEDGAGARSGNWGRVDKAIAKLDKDSGEIMREVVDALHAENADLRRQLQRTDSTTQKVAQSEASREFRQALVAAKVPVGTPEYERVIKTLRREVKGFAGAEARYDPMALEAIKGRFAATASRGALSRDEGTRLAAAKGGRTGRPAGGNPATAERIIKFADGFDPHRHNRLLAEADAAGKPRPTIKYD